MHTLIISFLIDLRVQNSTRKTWCDVAGLLVMGRHSHIKTPPRTGSRSDALPRKNRKVPEQVACSIVVSREQCFSERLVLVLVFLHWDLGLGLGSNTLTWD